MEATFHLSHQLNSHYQPSWDDIFAELSVLLV